MRNGFRPQWSESQPAMGMNIVRDIEKLAKITPIQIPVAPRSSA
jgi:hypothetical protein